MNPTTLPEQTTGKAAVRKKLGLVAGEGKLPQVLAKSARERGYDIVAFALSETAQVAISPHATETFLIYPGQVGRNLKLLKEAGAEEVVFIGKIPKLDVLRNLTKVDWTAIRELSKMSDFSDDTIQKAVGDFTERSGIIIRTQREFLEHLFPEVGILTRRKPTIAEYADIDYGVSVAKEIARLDIGQTVIVKDRIIMAVEAAEGTDAAIKRAAQLARGPVVVVKVAKVNHDQRFDTPTVGESTVRAMITEGKPGGVLAVTAGETMVIDQQELANFADSAGISIVVV